MTLLAFVISHALPALPGQQIPHVSPSTHLQLPCDAFQRLRALRAQPRRLSHFLRVALPLTLQTFLGGLYSTRRLRGIRVESLKLKTHCNQVKFLPPKREAFHERGGFCSGPSEYQKRLTSSETLDGLRRRLARILESRHVLQTSQV